MSKTAFVPELYGFHFGNGFTNQVKIEIAGLSIGSFTTYGRCGGMAFAALDYFHLGRPAPTHDADDFGGPAVPPDGSPLADYIYTRLLDSFNLDNVAKFITMTESLDHSTWIALPPADNRGTPRITKQDEIPKLRSQLDQGIPVALGLVGASSIGDIGSKNHQVVAYDYAIRPGTTTIDIWIYDCNHPDTRPMLTTVTDGSSNDFVVETIDGAPVGDPWRGFFVESYSPRQPSYVDLCLASGLVVPAGAVTDDPITASYVVKNAGAHQASLAGFELTLTDETRHSSTIFHRDFTPTLAPGQTATVSGQSAPVPLAGPHGVDATYVSMQGLHVPLLALVAGAKNHAEIAVAQSVAPTIAAHVKSMTPVIDQGVGYYDALLDCDVQNLSGQVTVRWQIDGQVLTGNPLSTRIKIGNAKTGFTYVRDIGVTATNGKKSVSTTLHVDLTPGARIEPNYAQSVPLTVTPSKKFGAPITSVQITNKYVISVFLGVRYSQVWVDAVTNGLLGTLTMQWTPAPVKQTGIGALIPMPKPDAGPGCDVSVTIVDEIGRSVVASAWVSDFIESGGFKGKLTPVVQPKQPAAEKWPHPGEWNTHTLGPLTEIDGRKVTLTDHTLTLGNLKVPLTQTIKATPHAIVVTTPLAPAKRVVKTPATRIVK